MAKNVYQKPIDGSHNPYSDDNTPYDVQLSTRQAMFRRYLSYEK